MYRLKCCISGESCVELEHHDIVLKHTLTHINNDVKSLAAAPGCCSIATAGIVMVMGDAEAGPKGDGGPGDDGESAG